MYNDTSLKEVLHHIVHRADGGTHEPENLRLQCSACHSAIHRGTLDVVDGVARRPNEKSHGVRAIDDAHVGASAFDAAAARVQACEALVGLGWKAVTARAAVDDAIAHVGTGPIEVVIREALRRCPRPK